MTTSDETLIAELEEAVKLENSFQHTVGDIRLLEQAADRLRYLRDKMIEDSHSKYDEAFKGVISKIEGAK